MCHLMRMKSPEVDIFDIAIFCYGDYNFAEDRHLLRPLSDINEDEIEFHGTSGRTNFNIPLRFCHELLQQYDQQYLTLQEEPQKVPPPLILFVSDGCHMNGRNPVFLAKKINSTALSIGVPPILVTIGLELGGDKPDEELLKAMASRGRHNQPLYFDVTDLLQFEELLATLGSSAACTPDDVSTVVDDQKRLPPPGGVK
ncbi:hypothetical protein [Aeoliella sp.]|uniref:hypothetical protein n=1 Tax=Aeoliella sp. TaxID=2795800 RepID=UPI003CCC231B